MLLAAGNNSSAKTFLKHIQPLLTFYRFLALAPIVVNRSADGEHYIKKSKIAQTYSRIVTVICIITLLMKCIKSYSEPHKGHFGIYHAYARSFLTFMTRFTCLQKSDEILLGIQRIADLRVDIPIKIVWATIALPCIGYGVMVVFSSTDLIIVHTRPPYTTSLVVTAVMFFDIVGVCSLFSWQVAVLGKGIQNLNQHVSTFFDDGTIFNAETLRPIMRAQNKYHEMCTALNSAYGYSMLYVLALVFLEAVFCIAFYYDQPENLDRISALIWTALLLAPSATLMQICQNAENEFEATTDNLGRIKALSVVQVEDNRLQLYEWEIQLRHQKLHFSAAGFFSLNATQIQTEFSTIVCYTVIMMQIF